MNAATLDVKLAVLNGVREHCEHAPVELWLAHSGRVVVRCYSECGNSITDLDLADLLHWAQHGNIAALPTPE